MVGNIEREPTARKIINLCFYLRYLGGEKEQTVDRNIEASQKDAIRLITELKLNINYDAISSQLEAVRSSKGTPCLISASYKLLDQLPDFVDTFEINGCKAMRLDEHEGDIVWGEKEIEGLLSVGEYEYRGDRT